jgi:hypothetical protein
MKRKFSYCSLLLGALWLTGFSGISHAQNSIGKIQAADPNLQGDGTLGPAAAAAMRGPLPMGDADVMLKRDANRAVRDSIRSGQTRATRPRDPAESGSAGPRPSMTPTIVDEHSFAGLATGPANDDSPVNVAGAIGPTRYIHAANDSVRIYGRDTNQVVATAKLNRLAGNADSVTSFNPQIIWDPTTDRFYYVMDSVFSAGNNTLSFGFSRTSTPNTFSSSDWCQYHYVPTDKRAGTFPDYPRLGDSEHFIIIGVNSYEDSTSNAKFVGSDLIAISKPPAGTNCPNALTTGTRLDLRDSANKRVFTPVPANQVDDNPTGFVVARNGTLPSDKLWFFKVTQDHTTLNPVFGAGRVLTLPDNYDLPPDAAQTNFHQLLETLDARPTQAVQAINPDRSGVHSFWMQHTISNAADEENPRSIVRWYEIDPVKPKLLRKGDIGTDSPDNFYFNAAISPDRRKDGNIQRFGNSFVIEYNVSSSVNEINPRIVAGSSFAGNPVKFLLIQDGIDGYKDATCPNDSDVCRWSNYSSASPDPRPTALGRGEIWGTNQYSGGYVSSKGITNFRSWIFGLRP